MSFNLTPIEGLFHSPQTVNGHVKKGTGSPIRLPGVTTVKWSQIGAALMFLSNLPSCQYSLAFDRGRGVWVQGAF